MSVETDADRSGRIACELEVQALCASELGETLRALQHQLALHDACRPVLTLLDEYVRDTGVVCSIMRTEIAMANDLDLPTWLQRCAALVRHVDRLNGGRERRVGEHLGRA